MPAQPVFRAPLGPEVSQLQRPGVLEAVNPHPDTGYAHGPVENPNPDWWPSAYLSLSLADRARYQIKAKDIADDIRAGRGPPNPRLKLNKQNWGICPVVVGPNNEMCRAWFEFQPALRRHLRQFHHGCFENPTPRGRTAIEKITGKNALYKLVLTGEWRLLNFSDEPGQGPSTNYMGLIATRCEEVAQRNPEFATRWGTVFHRGSIPEATPASQGRARTRGAEVPVTGIPMPQFTTPQAGTDTVQTPSAATAIPPSISHDSILAQEGPLQNTNTDGQNTNTNSQANTSSQASNTNTQATNNDA
ncbi:hypothetical protein PDE_06582 [Penicillium oxalicum 114-2]|uniref:Uncharacterized protein n=1 Tax=Penicillium oxalicum (strain 114-2 / CGMCC 5302) TaxID=933388 RepID=S8B9Z5_PENO1|nr:hypothetical protein PDE_06582 [Penicillium oxalicum 114-2]